MRVVIISPYYAPEHAGTAPYVTGLAEHLSETHEVVVLTGVPHYPEWRIQEGYARWHSVDQRKSLRIERLWHYVPACQSAMRRGAYEFSFALRILFAGWRELAEVVIVFTPPVLSAWPAWWIALRRGAAFGVVVHDLAGQGARATGIAGGRSIAGFVSLLEGHVLRRADGVVLLHQRFRSTVTGKLGVPSDRIDVISNWSHISGNLDEADDRRLSLGWGEETIVLHTGNMGLKQDLENVVEAARLAEASEHPIRFVLMGDGNQRLNLTARSRHVSRLTIMDPVPAGDYPAVLRAADILLVNERRGVSEMSIPSKLTSYFTAGRPVLAVTDSDSPTANEMRRSGAGPIVASGAPEALLAAVESLALNTGRAAEHGMAAQRFAREHFGAAQALQAYQSWAEALVAERHVRRRNWPTPRRPH